MKRLIAGGLCVAFGVLGATAAAQDTVWRPSLFARSKTPAVTLRAPVAAGSVQQTSFAAPGGIVPVRSQLGDAHGPNFPMGPALQADKGPIQNPGQFPPFPNVVENKGPDAIAQPYGYGVAPPGNPPGVPCPPGPYNGGFVSGPQPVAPGAGHVGGQPNIVYPPGTFSVVVPQQVSPGLTGNVNQPSIVNPPGTYSVGTPINPQQVSPGLSSGVSQPNIVYPPNPYISGTVVSPQQSVPVTSGGSQPTKLYLSAKS